MSLTPTEQDPQSSYSSSRLILWIVIGVFIWGVIHAIGAYMFNWNFWRAVMVLGCVAGFLGFWLLLLWSKRQRE